MNKIKDIDFLDSTLARYGLKNLGAFHHNNDDRHLKSIKTLVLVGPDEPKFWKIFIESYEFKASIQNPLDSWSCRALNNVAKKLDAVSFFPFGGSERMPFVKWALRTGQTFVSPSKLLVHIDLGLSVSFRGALGFAKRLNISSKSKSSPCVGCSKPCLSSCPAGAISLENYDTAKCIEYLREDENKSCNSGCLVRRSCPVGQEKRLPAQSQFHMRAFLSS
ncbi:MAG: ferredoxin [Pseudomonadota bacterium]|nr:ferredoxin [Pseudomonadota bacterium]